MSKIIALTIILGLVLFFFHNKKNDHQTLAVKIKNQTFNLEIADNITRRTKGLSGKNSLCPTCGMIFVYQKQGIYPFWMKNTHFPLDIIWLDKNGQIIDIKQGQAESLDILKNSTPARYIIEIPADSASLNLGDILNLPDEIN